MITWVFSTLILVFLPINIHENHWILLAANFWVHPKDASLFEMASLMGKPKGVATWDSELDYFHGTLPGWGSYKSRYYTNTTQWWKRLESPRSSKGYVLKKSWDAVSILTCSCFAVSILTCSCLKDEWILFKVIIKKWSLKHIYFVKLEVIFPCLQYLLLNFRQSIPARHRKMTTKTWHAYHLLFSTFTRPFTKPVGGTFTLEKKENELDFFFQFFDDNLFEKIVDETNSYAEKCQQTNPNPKWKKVGVPEMKAFFGIYIDFSIVRYQHTL